MERMDRSYSLLLASSSEKFNETIWNLLSGGRYRPIRSASSANDARRCLLESPFDLLVINAPLPDEFGTRLALDMSRDSGSGILLLCKAEHYPDISARLSPSGVLTLPKPTSLPMIEQSLQLLCGTRERLRLMEQKTATLEEKMAEIRLVNRAKWVLIDRLKMTEEQAHRTIEKQAMDQCVSRRVIAENILSIYQ